MKVHTQKANKDYPAYGIKKGDTYYWWKFRYGSKIRSKTYPRPSQLTQSAYLATIYDIQDELGSCQASDMDELISFRDDIVSRLEELRDEQEEKRSNMPDQLQESATGELLQERYDALDSAIDELNSIDCDDYDEPDEDQLRDDAIEDLGMGDEEGDEPIDEEKIAQWIAEKKQEKLDEWLDEKKDELSNVSIG